MSTKRNQVTLALRTKSCVSSSHLVILLRGGGNHSFAGDNSSWCTWLPCISCLRCMLSAHHRERPAKLEAAVGQRKRDESLLTLPETNSSHLKIGLLKRKGSSSNHKFSGALAVRFRVVNLKREKKNSSRKSNNTIPSED